LGSPTFHWRWGCTLSQILLFLKALFFLLAARLAFFIYHLLEAIAEQISFFPLKNKGFCLKYLTIPEKPLQLGVWSPVSRLITVAYE